MTIHDIITAAEAALTDCTYAQALNIGGAFRDIALAIRIRHRALAANCDGRMVLGAAASYLTDAALMPLDYAEYMARLVEHPDETLVQVVASSLGRAGYARASLLDTKRQRSDYETSWHTREFADAIECARSAARNMTLPATATHKGKAWHS